MLTSVWQAEGCVLLTMPFTDGGKVLSGKVPVAESLYQSQLAPPCGRLSSLQTGFFVE